MNRTRTIQVRKDLIKMMRESAEYIGRDFTEPDDDWIFVMMGYSPDGARVIGVDPAMFDTEEGKDRLAEALAAFAQENGFVAYGMVISMWYYEIGKETADALDRAGKGWPKASQSPNRKEGLLIIGADRFGEEGISADIIRHEGKPPTLTEWKPMPNDDGPGESHIEGRFVEPMRRALRHQG